jgi:hypothetical protein
MTTIEQAKHEIALAAKDAVSTIANAASEASKLVEEKHNRDHDLLVILNTKMEGIKNDISDLKDGTAHRIDELEKNKLNISDSYKENFLTQDTQSFKDLNTRLLNLETAKTQVTVLLSIASAILTFLTGLLLYHIFHTTL